MYSDASPKPSRLGDRTRRCHPSSRSSERVTVDSYTDAAGISDGSYPDRSIDDVALADTSVFAECSFDTDSEVGAYSRGAEVDTLSYRGADFRRLLANAPHLAGQLAELPGHRRIERECSAAAVGLDDNLKDAAIIGLTRHPQRSYRLSERCGGSIRG